MTTTKVKTERLVVINKTITITFSDYALFDLVGNEYSCKITPYYTEARTKGEKSINEAIKKIEFIVSNISRAKKIGDSYLLKNSDIDKVADWIDMQFAKIWDELTK